MKKEFRELTGAVSALIGFIFILNFLSSITGFVVAENIGKFYSSIIGLVLVIGGIVLFLSRKQKEGNLARQILEGGAIIQDPKKIMKIAKKVEKQEGYSGRNVKEGYQVIDETGKPLTVIPRHRVSVGVYRNIMDALATGIPSFRRRTGYSAG